MVKPQLTGRQDAASAVAWPPWGQGGCDELCAFAPVADVCAALPVLLHYIHLGQSLPQLQRLAIAGHSVQQQLGVS